MKIVFFIAGLAILLAACNSSQQVKNSISGIYVAHAESAYSIADDTLIIAKDYHIIRRTTFRRTGGSPQHQVKNFVGVWDESKQALQISENGAILLFRPDDNKLLMGNSEYRKL